MWLIPVARAGLRERAEPVDGAPQGGVRRRSTRTRSSASVRKGDRRRDGDGSCRIVLLRALTARARARTAGPLTPVLGGATRELRSSRVASPTRRPGAVQGRTGAHVHPSFWAGQACLARRDRSRCVSQRVEVRLLLRLPLYSSSWVLRLRAASRSLPAQAARPERQGWDARAPRGAVAR